MTKSRARRTSNRVTLQDVARQARVSAITVSRTLRSPERVAEATRSKVEAAVRKLGYIPNRAASMLASARSHTVALIIPSLTNAVFSDVVRAVYDVLLPKGYQVILGNSHYSPLEEERLIATFLEQTPDAMIVTGLDQTGYARKLLEHAGIPVVQIMESGTDVIDMNVGFSHFQAGREITRFLIESGYGSVGFLGARMDPRTQRRMVGYQQAIDDAGLTWKGRIATSPQASSVRLGGELLRDLLSSGQTLDAVFCCNDDLAMGAIFECQRSNIQVPDDLAIAGFNDLEPSASINPSLTSVLTPRYPMGKLAAQMLLDALHRKATVQANRIVDLGYQIVRRQST